MGQTRRSLPPPSRPVLWRHTPFPSRCRHAALLAAAVSAAQFVAAQTFSFPPPPAGVFPALWFGANESGLGLDARLLAQHSLVGWGWQQGTSRSAFRHGETALAQAAAAAAASLGAGGNATAPPPPALFVYRMAQMAWRLFDVPRAADDAQAGGGSLFLRDNDNDPAGTQCRQRIPSPPSGQGANATSPLYAFAGPGGVGVTPAGAFFVEEVVGELSVEGAIQAAFFDETDWSACGYSFAQDGCANISDAFRAADLAAKLPSLRSTVDALGAAGIAPILSSKNLLAAAWEGLSPNATRPCVIPHDAYFNALAGGAPYLRFYEFFAARGPDEDAATIAQIMIEADAGVGLVARAPADNTSVCANTSESALVGVSASGRALAPPRGILRQPTMLYSLASFLIASSSPYSYFGVSTGWLDSDWCWHEEAYALAASCGAPVAAAQRLGPYSYIRGFFSCFVSIDTLAGEGVVTYCGEGGATEIGCR